MANFIKGFVLIIWTVVCFYLFRLGIYKYWAIDIASSLSWQEITEIWHAGLVFPWLFILSFIVGPAIWICGIILIRKVDFYKIIKNIITYPLLQIRKRSLATVHKKAVKIKKNKSYTEIRPPALKPVMGESFSANPRKNVEDAHKMLESDRYDEDDSDDEDFYQDRNARREESIDDFERTMGRDDDDDIGFIGSDQKSFDNRGQNYSNESNGISIQETLESSGYKTLSDIKIGSDTIDYVAISNEAVVLCFEDAKPGDWLADEERFNDEEPLWFSESAQRVSPAYQALTIKNKVNDAIQTELPEIAVVPVIIITKGSIINAADMLDTWEEMQVFLGRAGEGGPSDLKKINNLIPKNPDDSVSDEIVEQIENILKSLK